MTDKNKTTTNILDNHQVKLVEANQKILNELLEDMSIPVIKKVEALCILVINAQILKSLDC